MAAQVARGWVLVVGARSPGGSSGLPLLECSVGAYAAAVERPAL